jgi:hypothetical protein
VGLSKLEFSKEGLTIRNSGFKIFENNEEVFSTKEGNLYIKGYIDAIGGSIGDIELVDGSLVGADKSFIISSSKIIAKNIELGESASIGTEIKIGDLILRNPDSGSANPDDRTVLSSGKIALKDNGYLNIGQIEAFGGSDNSPSYLKSENDRWAIYGDGSAKFEDITTNNLRL